MNASNKSHIDVKSVAFIQGRRSITLLLFLRRLFEGGVYSREAFIRVITVCKTDLKTLRKPDICNFSILQQ